MDDNEAREKKWFELSNPGWRAQNLGRPLASLLHEGIQNAFDQDVSHVHVDIHRDRITIADNGTRGFTDQKLAFTVFLTDKGDSAIMRGRHGRGLKELISAMDGAIIETIGFTMHFDENGRKVSPNSRKRGTKLTLLRRTTAAEIEETVSRLRLIIPPKNVALRINGTRLTRPRRFAVLTDCLLDTVITQEGAERIVERDTTVTLLKPRSRDEEPHVFEMGMPIQPFPTPWHVDVAQRVPLSRGRDRLDDKYRLRLLATLFESLVADVLEPKHLEAPWTDEVLAGCKLSKRALEAYVSRALPTRPVLPSSAESDDRARQAGAHVLSRERFPSAQRKALARVMPTSEQFIESRRQKSQKIDALQPHEQRAVAFLGQLAKRILGRTVKMRVVRKPPEADGIVESATFDRDKLEMSINIAGHIDLKNPLEPRSLGILFHELAHARTTEHDFRFIEELEKVAGLGAQILALEGRVLAEASGVALRKAGGKPAAAATSKLQVGLAHWPTPAPISLKDLKKQDPE